ncbi:hypothetical protein LG943_08595 [Streptomonospora sp. S1-112]|uniref:Uncharacterized protein n=1 Tax=Streptomonospora mangrovi TaxID=2883123 RepID=A0A9X3NM73_9ACTN|nr:hypothetical protein [Streptomonospora mangrovi]MDA0564384.1 hypothetical protein [Streptomonospora mangrovi]
MHLLSRGKHAAPAVWRRLRRAARVRPYLPDSAARAAEPTAPAAVATAPIEWCFPCPACGAPVPPTRIGCPNCGPPDTEPIAQTEPAAMVGCGRADMTDLAEAVRLLLALGPDLAHSAPARETAGAGVAR